MDTIPITVNLTQQVIDGLCGLTNYQDTITDENGKSSPNPQTKNDRVEYSLEMFAKQQAMNYLTKQAAIASKTQISQDLGITGPVPVANQSAPIVK